MKRRQFQMLPVLAIAGSLFLGTAAHAQNVTIGMSFPSATHGWMGAIIKNAQDQAKASGIQHVMTTAADPNKQTNDIEDLIAKKVGAVVMLPIESSAMTRAATLLKQANIPLIVVDREVNTQDFAALIKGDNVGIGVNAAHYIAKALGGNGNVVEIIGVPASVTTQRSQGYRDTVAKQYPGLKLIASQAGDFQREKSLNVMQNLLQQHPKIDAVYTHDDEMALGVLQAIREAKRTDIKVVTGAGGNKAVYKLIADKDPMMKATFIYSPLMVKDAVKVAIDVAKGKPPANKTITIPAEAVTAENVAAKYDAGANY
jgi:ribose transport system substrate-binding protein